MKNTEKRLRPVVVYERKRVEDYLKAHGPGEITLSRLKNDLDISWSDAYRYGKKLCKKYNLILKVDVKHVKEYASERTDLIQILATTRPDPQNSSLRKIASKTTFEDVQELRKAAETLLANVEMLQKQKEHVKYYVTASRERLDGYTEGYTVSTSNDATDDMNQVQFFSSRKQAEEWIKSPQAAEWKDCTFEIVEEQDFEWKCPRSNCTVVLEQALSDPGIFTVWRDEEKIGEIHPDNSEDLQECIEALNMGADPIKDKWEDGLGNTCRYEGWGQEESRDSGWER